MKIQNKWFYNPVIDMLLDLKTDKEIANTLAIEKHNIFVVICAAKKCGDLPYDFSRQKIRIQHKKEKILGLFKKGHDVEKISKTLKVNYYFVARTIDETLPKTKPKPKEKEEPEKPKATCFWDTLNSMDHNHYRSLRKGRNDED